MKANLLNYLTPLITLIALGCNQVERSDQLKILNEKNKAIATENKKHEQHFSKLDQEKQALAVQLKKQNEDIKNLTSQTEKTSNSLKEANAIITKSNQQVTELTQSNSQLKANQFQIRQYGHFILKNAASVSFHSEKPQVILQEIPGKDSEGRDIANLMITRQESQSAKKDNQPNESNQQNVGVTTENIFFNSIGCKDEDLKALNLKKSNVKNSDFESLLKQKLIHTSEYDNQLTVLKFPNLIMCREIELTKITTEKFLVIANEVIFLNAQIKLDLNNVYAFALKTNHLQLVQKNKIELQSLKLKKQEANDHRLYLQPAISIDAQKITDFGNLELRIEGASFVD